ncbi:MAG: LysM peptidoglycan-binding domain-containing protein [Ilumatobacteraceae bacterium]
MTATFHPASNFQRTVGVPAHVRSHPAADRREIVRHQHGPTPNYAVRRTLVAAVALAVLAAAAVAVVQTAGALVDLGGRPAAASEVTTTAAGDELVRSIHVAAAGDSLWSIADLYRGPVGRDRYVDALISLNGGTDVLVGQAIRLP